MLLSNESAPFHLESKRAVLGVLEAALEIGKLGTGQVHKDTPLMVRVGSHLVTHSLDLERESATVWAAEPVRESVRSS